uniref:Uncharacterized protein n=1 Tax=Leersia perrieri TaxID=77586 RepID=A0A0D9UYQ7_9ORYZ
MDFGRRKSFSFFEEDWKSRPTSAGAARTPVHHHYAAAAAGGARSPARDPPRLSLSSVHGVDLPTIGGAGGMCSPWIQSPRHGRVPFPSSPAAAIYHCLSALHRLDGDVHALAVSRGVLFTASDSGRVRAWAAPGCFNRGYLDVGRGRVPAIAACGGTLVTSHSRDHHVRVWTVCASAVCDHIRAKKAATLPAKKNGILSTFVKRRQPPHHRDTVSCLVLHAAAGLLYTASHDHTVKAWKLSDGSCADSFVAHDGAVNAMLVNDADGCIFTASDDGTVKMWRRVYGGTTHTLIVVLRSTEQLSPVNALTICHSGPTRGRCFLYAGSSDGYVNVWEKEAAVGRPAHVGFLKGHRLAVFCLASGCGGRVVVSGSEDATMRVWRRDGGGGKGGATSHTCLAVIEGHRGPVRCLAVGGGEAGEVEGSMVVYSAGLDRSVKVWRIRVVGKEEEEDDDDDDEDDDLDDDGGGENDVASTPAGKEVDVAVDHAREEAAVVAEEEAEVVVGLGATPVLSPVWVEKRRTSRG